MPRYVKYFISAAISVLVAIGCFVYAERMEEEVHYHFEKRESRERLCRISGWVLIVSAGVDLGMGTYCLNAEKNSITNNPNVTACPDCRQAVSRTLTRCPHCGREIPRGFPRSGNGKTGEWECPNCHSKNPRTTSTCQNCKALRK